MKFGEFVRVKRMEARITVRRFAEMLGISPSFLCDLENGNRAFPFKSRKYPDLLDKMIVSLSLSDQDSILIKQLAEESMLSGDRIPSELSDYLQRVPEAQQMLRVAKEKGLTKEDWEEFLKEVEKK